MFGWLDELLNLRLKYREAKIQIELEARKCESCEVLKTALERSNYEKSQLLQQILKVDKDEIKPSDEPQPIRRHVSWKVRQQILEEQDREKARLIQEFRNNTEKLEKDMNIVDSENSENAKREA